PESGGLVSRRVEFARMGLDDDHRALVPRRPDPHEGGAKHARVLVENRLAGISEERAGGGLHAIRRAPAIPDPALLAQVANIAHGVPPGVAVPECGARGMPYSPDM